MVEREGNDMTHGTILRDKATGELVVLVESRGPRILVSGIASLKDGATLVQRAQRCLPADDFELASDWGAAVLAVGAL